MHVFVFTGAGVSRESGLQTFRDSDGLWEGHRVEDVATLDAWRRDTQLVLNFYNMRRRDARRAMPNAAHQAIAALESKHRVTVATQNIDDLHERAGSSHVLHLHGEILKGRSTFDELLVADWLDDMAIGDLMSDGSQVRPHVVWFGEAVLELDRIAEIASGADAVLVVGTSLAVYPAAGLVDIVRPRHAFLVDPRPVRTSWRHVEAEAVAQPATEGVPVVVSRLMEME